MTEKDDKIRVLFVDDEADFILSMSKALGRRGFLVTSAPDGRAGLEMLAAEPFDVILLDVKMPGLDGDGVFREVRRMQIDTPVVMLTGHGSVQQAFSLSKEGVFEYLAKPCEAEVLCDVLRRAAQSGTKREASVAADAPARVLLSIDETDAPVAACLERDLSVRGLDVVAVADVRSALDQLAKGVFDVVVMAPGERAAVLALRAAYPSVGLIVLVKRDAGVLASELMKIGAFDVLDLTVGAESLFRRIRAAHEQRRKRLEHERETRVKEILARHPD